MTDRLDISVITACTGVKARSDAPPLTMRDFARGRQHLEDVHRRRSESLIPAEQLYRGQQHVRLMRGVEVARALGHRVTVSIVSAGYGLVRGDELIAPYECTFQGMSARERRAWAGQLSLADHVAATLERQNDATAVLLGDDYFDACGIDGPIPMGSPTAVLSGARTALRIAPNPKVHPLVLTEQDTRRFGCGLVGLKGEVASRLLASIAENPSTASDFGSADLLARLAEAPASRQMMETA